MSKSLGRDWKRAVRVAFDPQLAAQSMRLYWAADVPKVDPAVPDGVRDIRFTAELTDVQTVSVTDAVAQGGLYLALLGGP